MRQRIAELESGISTLDAESDDLLQRFAQARAEVELQRARVSEAETAKSLTELRRTASQQRVGELETGLEERRQRLTRRIQSIARFGAQGYLRLFLSIDADSDLLPALRQLRHLIRRDATAIEAFRSAREELTIEIGRLDRLESEAARWLEEEREREQRLDQLLGELEILMRQVERRRARLIGEAEALAVREQRLERMIIILEREAPDALDGVPIVEFRGALDWPVAGRVEIGFGPRRDPRYGTTTPHNGIEIAVAEPGPVQVVYPGTVRYAAVFQDFGYTVVVQHPGRVLTLYAGLETLRVSEGDVLSFGDAVGDSGARLYFELRIRSTPEDPRSWLR
ncbi:MAG TPA: peptidoglycan DD-metalloendopeptidase family protein [Thermoanaerobaculia bacterium]|nr:peptidoglycan DD-metalloendopeptidase family protein [Thermoanaerobaculia bacterium]